jgi:phage terminase large subunit GpA-like protein
MCAVRYHYWVPCPHCNGYQTLQWKQVKWPAAEPEEERAKHAERLKVAGLAYYECEHCQGRIDDHHKPRMNRRGMWASEDQVVTQDGRVVGPKPIARRVGFKVSGLYSPWNLFGQLASEWISAQGDPNALAVFINERLAEPFEEQRQKIEPGEIEQKAKGGYPPMLVPKWARSLIATADTQGADEQSGYFWYVIRAWGYDYRSQLIDYGVCSSKQELIERCLHRQIPMEGAEPVAPQLLAIDSGGPRWSEVYQLAMADQRVKPAKGSAHKRSWMLEERPQKKHGVVLWEIDTEQSKDLLSRLIHDPDKTKWLPHNEINADYCSQMSSESKIFNPTLKREEWVEIVKNNNHLWDCEHMQCAVAWRLGCGIAAPPEEQPRQTDAQVSSDFMNRMRAR